MTREIKFRAWDKKRQCFINISDFGSMVFPVDGGGKTIKLNHSDDIELIQFTGLLDKNGKEIYEGDILNHAQDDFAGGINVVVEWFGAGFYAGYGYHIPIPEILKKEAEIIGNVYENPDLLTPTHHD